MLAKETMNKVCQIPSPIRGVTPEQKKKYVSQQDKHPTNKNQTKQNKIKNTTNNGDNKSKTKNKKKKKIIIKNK